MYLPNHIFAREEFYPVVDSMDSLCMAVSFPLFQATTFFGPSHNITHISFDGNAFLSAPQSGAVNRLAFRDPSIPYRFERSKPFCGDLKQPKEDPLDEGICSFSGAIASI